MRCCLLYEEMEVPMLCCNLLEDNSKGKTGRSNIKQQYKLRNRSTGCSDWAEYLLWRANDSLE